MGSVDRCEYLSAHAALGWARGSGVTVGGARSWVGRSGDGLISWAGKNNILWEGDASPADLPVALQRGRYARTYEWSRLAAVHDAVATLRRRALADAYGGRG